MHLAPSLLLSRQHSDVLHRAGASLSLAHTHWILSASALPYPPTYYTLYLFSLSARCPSSSPQQTPIISLALDNSTFAIPISPLLCISSLLLSQFARAAFLTRAYNRCVLSFSFLILPLRGVFPLFLFFSPSRSRESCHLARSYSATSPPLPPPPSPPPLPPPPRRRRGRRPPLSAAR